MSTFTRQLSLVAGALLLVTVLLIVLVYPRWQEIVTALTPQPETLTELYFDNHLTLPTLVAFNTPFQFSFSIHNLEGRDIAYPIEITLEPDLTTLTAIQAAQTTPANSAAQATQMSQATQTTQPTQTTPTAQATPAAAVVWTRAILIPAGQTKSIPVELSLPPSTAARVKVQVALVNLDQTIHFWLKTPEFLRSPNPAAASPSPAASPTATPRPNPTATPAVILPN